MYTRPHSWPLTRLIAWAAVTAAALLATTFALSSPAWAQEDAPPDTTTEPPGTTTTESPTDEPTEPEPTEPEPTTTPSEADPPKKSQEDAEDDGVTAAVEPDFGYTKFRVGVQLDDPSAAGGLTTLGSTIRITERFEDGSTEVTECTTTLEDPVEPTTTYCEDLGPTGVPGGFEDYYWSSFEGGSTITVRQTAVNDGLVIIDGTKIVEPCGECEENVGDVLLTDGLESDDDDDGDDGDDDGDDGDDDGDDGDDDEEGTLPDVGAPDATLLGFGAILLALGSRLIVGGRSRTSHRRDGAVI